MQKSCLKLCSATIASVMLQIGCTAGTAWSANLTWDTATGDGSSITAGNGNWNLTATNRLWNQGGTNISWSQTNSATPTNSAIFSGADGNYNVNVTTAIAAQSVSFNSSGYSIGTDTAGASVAVSTNVNIAAGKSVSINNGVTFNFNSSLFLTQRTTLGAGSALNINSGAVLNRTINVATDVGSSALAFAGSGTVNVSGTVSTTSITPAGGIIVADQAGNSVTVNINTGGNITATGSSMGLLLCNDANTATLNIAGNLSTNSTSAYGGINMNASGVAGNATLNLNAGGAISTYAIVPTFNGTINSGNSTFNFNGGTLSAIANHGSFLTGLSAVNIQVGGATINTGSYNITIGNSLLDGGGGGGGLTKNGSGTLTLAGNANTYTGATTVTAGKVITTYALQNKTALSISNGATVDIPVNGGSSRVTYLRSLSTTGSGAHIELHDNDLVVDYGSNATTYLSIYNKVKSGLSILGGAGNIGITSAEVDSQSVQGTMLAVVDDGDPLIAGAITATSGFAIPSPTTSVLVKYTWFGDSNLDGTVDGSDYALLDSGFTSGGSLNGWIFGDYDYSGTVDGSDYALIDTGFISQSGVLPEPGSIAVLFLLSKLSSRRLRKF